jgi:hypothetical protein
VPQPGLPLVQRRDELNLRAWLKGFRNNIFQNVPTIQGMQGDDAPHRQPMMLAMRKQRGLHSIKACAGFADAAKGSGSDNVYHQYAISMRFLSHFCSKKRMDIA